jgi:hypothetical protein
MTQKVPKFRWFDQHWRPRLDLAVKVLREIEDAWFRANQPFPVRETAAVLLNIFAFDFYSTGFLRYRGVRANELWRRSLHDWFSSVGSPEFECARISPNYEASEYSQFVDCLCEMLASAAHSWEQVAPDRPSCEEVVQLIVEVLAKNRLVIIRYD